MARKELTLDNLKDLDFGKIGEAFNQEIQRVVRDCNDRPGDKRARKVAIEFAVVPVLGEGGDCEECLVEAQITSAVPKRRTKVYTMLPNRNGQLAFHPELPDEPDGQTLYDPPEPNQQ